MKEMGRIFPSLFAYTYKNAKVQNVRSNRIFIIK